MKKTVYIMLTAAAFFLCVYSAAAADIVDNSLGKEFVRIFPELKDGYIDLNGNSRKDRNDELDEVVPDSIVRDSVLQAQEVLDFLIRNYRYIPVDRLTSVRTSLDSPQGAISEIIALRYARLVDNAIGQRQKLGDGLLFLTPSAFREAITLMEQKIAALARAYRKEGSDAEKDFIRTEEEIFSLLDRGYPIPDGMEEEDRAVLVSSLINTLLTEQNSDPADVKTAIRALGKLEAEASVPYLTDLLADGRYRRNVLRTLGDIGSREVLPVLFPELEKERAPEDLLVLVGALGRIGGTETLQRLLALLDTVRQEEKPQMVLSVLQALENIASSGSSDPRLFAVFKDTLSDEDPDIRAVSIRGVSHFPRSGAADLLIPLLQKEKNRENLIETIRALNQLPSTNAMRSFLLLLKDTGTDDTVRVEILNAIGSSKEGVGLLQSVLEYLGSENQEVRRAAARAVIDMHGINAQAVTAGLSRLLISSDDERLLTEGSAILSRLADPASAAYLLQILQKPFPGVKKNITWALYRIGKDADPRSVEELRNLVTSETEPLSVRINAVRALGSIGYDTPQLKVWQTLLTIARIRGEKYGMLRFFAIRALGDLAPADGEVLSTLALLASRDGDSEIRKEAVKALQNLARVDAETAAALAKAFRKESDIELKVRILETLGDMGYEELRDLASPMLSDNTVSTPVKKRILYSLSRTGGEQELSAILDAARDVQLRDYIGGFLEDADPYVLGPVVSRRLKTETDEGVLSVLEMLESRFSSSY